MVRVDSPTLGHALENQRIQQLPINGRSYQTLLATVPGIDSTGIPQAYGMRTNTSVTLFDGAPVNETYEGWDFSRPPGLDSISEVQRGGQQLLGEIHAPHDDHSVQQERHQHGPRSAVRDQPEQRLRCGPPPAGQLHQAALL